MPTGFLFNSFNICILPSTTVAGFPGSEFVLQAMPPATAKPNADRWLQVVSVSTITLNIPSELDKGEREAIALALETEERQILLDEREARQVAKSLGLQAIGTLGILLLAKNRKIITQVQPLLDAMINTAQYWVSRSLYEQVLQQARELID